MTILRPRPVSTRLFSYDRRARVFTAESSDLGGPLERVYDDAADVGLTLVSETTGVELVYRVMHHERDLEGELLWTDLEPVDPRRRGLCTVRLFND